MRAKGLLKHSSRRSWPPCLFVVSVICAVWSFARYSRAYVPCLWRRGRRAPSHMAPAVELGFGSKVKPIIPELVHRRRKPSGSLHASSNGLLAAPVAPTKTLLDRLNHLLEGGLGSVLLLLAAGVSMTLANNPKTSGFWLEFWQRGFGPALGAHALTYRGWVNEGLMSLFFFYVGLEIKKELVEGSLSSPRKALLPCLAAFGGMVIPMLVYTAVNKFFPGGSMVGVTIPMATDIAFAMGIFGFFRRRMPTSAEPFLLTLATVDDLGAILVIAFCFAGTLVPQYITGGIIALMSAMVYAYRGFETSRGMALPGLALWYCLLRGGVNADIAGFLIALCLPIRSTSGGDLVERLIRRWSPVCGLVILPLFALANCAIPIKGVAASLSSGGVPVAVGVALGLLLGKPLGILGASLLALRVGIASMPDDMSAKHISIVGLLGAMGFTMCLFLIESSLEGSVAEVTKLAMLLASLIAAIASVGAMYFFCEPRVLRETSSKIRRSP